MANKMGFGVDHFSLPTPGSITGVVTAISIILPAFMVWVNSADNLFGEKATHVITSLGSLFTLLSNVARPFFGKKVDEATIPTKDVSALK